MTISNDGGVFVRGGGGAGDALTAPAIGKLYGTARREPALNDYAVPGQFDWSDALDAFKAENPNLPVVTPDPEYALIRTFFGNCGNVLHGIGGGIRADIENRTRIIPVDGSEDYIELDGTRTANGFLLCINMLEYRIGDPDPFPTSIRPFPSNSSGTYKGILIDGNIDRTSFGANAGTVKNAGIKGVYAAAPIGFKDCGHSYCGGFYEITSEYHDHFYLENVTGSQLATGTNVLGNKPGQGDGYLSLRRKTGNRIGETKRNAEASFVSGSRSFLDGLSIEGNAGTDNCYGASIANYHESSVRTFDRGGVISIVDYVHNEADLETPLRVKNSSNANKKRSSFTFLDTSIGQDISLYGGMPDQLQADIDIEAGCSVAFKGFRRVLGRSGALESTQVMMPIVSIDGVINQDYLNYGHLMFDHARFVNGKLLLDGVYPDISGVSNTINSIILQTIAIGDADQVTWQGATGDYAIYPRFVTDPVRLIGQSTTPSSNETIVSLVNGGPIPEILLNQSSGANALHSCIIEIYMRNVATSVAGEYERYVQIPVHLCSSVLLNDTGANFRPWIPLANVAPVALNNNGISAGGTLSNGIAKLKGVASRPTRGTWKIGDFVERTTYISFDGSPNRLLGYVRLTNGSSHTDGVDWKEQYIVSERYPANFYTGHAEYSDTQYTESSPFIPTVGTRVSLPNNAGTVYDSQKPIYITSYYDSATQKILGRNNDGVNIKVRMYVKPTSGGGGAATKIRLFIDIGGAVGIVDAARQELDKGAGVEDFVSFSFPAYNLGTWVANGGDVQIEVDGDVDIYGVAFFFSQGHKAR